MERKIGDVFFFEKPIQLLPSKEEQVKNCTGCYFDPLGIWGPKCYPHHSFLGECGTPRRKIGIIFKEIKE